MQETQETRGQALGWEDPLRRERLPTPVFWPGEFHGLYSPWDHKELDTTEQLSLVIEIIYRVYTRVNILKYIFIYIFGCIGS